MLWPWRKIRARDQSLVESSDKLVSLCQFFLLAVNIDKPFDELLLLLFFFLAFRRVGQGKALLLVTWHV